MEGYLANRASPRVLLWFRVYCVAMAVIYGLVVFGVAVVLFPDLLGEEEPAAFRIGYGAFIILIGLVLCVPYAAVLFLAPRPWVWVFDLVLIGVGMTSCCTLPAAIPLLVFWLRPETRAYFGRN